MSNTKLKILQRFKKHKGQYVLDCDFRAVRFLALIEDQNDYHYMLFDGKRVFLQSVLLFICPLKGYIPGKNYAYIKRAAQFNDEDQTLKGQDLINFKNKMEKLREGEVFLTPVCWDIN